MEWDIFEKWSDWIFCAERVEISFDLWSGTSFAVETMGLETDPWSRPMGKNGLVIIPDKFDPSITVKLAPKAELALTWILTFFDEVNWIRPRLNAGNIEAFLAYHHAWFQRGSPEYRHYVFGVPLPKFSSADDMSRSELEDLDPWRDPSDPDNKTKAQVNVVVQDSEEEKAETPPPNPLRKTTVKDDYKGWPTHLERSDSETIDLTKEVTKDIQMDEEYEEVDITTPTPAKKDSILFLFFILTQLTCLTLYILEQK